MTPARGNTCEETPPPATHPYHPPLYNITMATRRVKLFHFASSIMAERYVAQPTAYQVGQQGRHLLVGQMKMNGQLTWSITVMLAFLQSAMFQTSQNCCLQREKNMTSTSANWTWRILIRSPLLNTHTHTHTHTHTPGACRRMTY